MLCVFPKVTASVALMLSVKQESCDYQFLSHGLTRLRKKNRVFSFRGRHSIHSAIRAVKVCAQVENIFAYCIK